MKRVQSIFIAYILLPTICILGCITVYSCKKDTGPPIPVIILTSPSDTTVINAGDTVLINGMVSDNKSLHELYFTFRNTSTDSVFFSDHPYVHGTKIYNYDYVWYPSDTADYKFTVTAEDHDGNTTTEDFFLTVN